MAKEARMDTRRRRRGDGQIVGHHSHRPDYRRERLAERAAALARGRRALVAEARKALRCGEMEIDI